MNIPKCVSVDLIKKNDGFSIRAEIDNIQMNMIFDILKMLSPQKSFYEKLLKELVPKEAIQEHIENTINTNPDIKTKFIYLRVADVQKYLSYTEQNILYILENKIMKEKQKDVLS